MDVETQSGTVVSGLAADSASLNATAIRSNPNDGPRTMDDVNVAHIVEMSTWYVWYLNIFSVCRQIKLHVILVTWLEIKYVPCHTFLTGLVRWPMMAGKKNWHLNYFLFHSIFLPQYSFFKVLFWGLQSSAHISADAAAVSTMCFPRTRELIISGLL